MYGASMEPIRAAHEHAPIAAFLTTVGISSAVKMYTIPNAAAAPALPIKASNIVNGWRSEIEPVREKTDNLGSDQVRHKPDCTVTEDG